MKKLVTALAVVALLGACDRKADHDTGALERERSGMDTIIQSSSIKDTTVVKADTNDRRRHGDEDRQHQEEEGLRPSNPRLSSRPLSRRVSPFVLDHLFLAFPPGRRGRLDGPRLARLDVVSAPANSPKSPDFCSFRLNSLSARSRLSSSRSLTSVMTPPFWEKKGAGANASPSMLRRLLEGLAPPILGNVHARGDRSKW